MDQVPTPVDHLLLHSVLVRSSVPEDTVQYLTQGFQFGFRLGHDHQDTPLPVPKNLVSARLHPAVVDDKLAAEVDAGRIAGPFSEVPMAGFVVSPMGVVPKKEEGKFRRIHHLSFPEGHSVNDHIPQVEKTVHYQRVDDAVQAIYRSGKMCWLAKTDIASAYRIVPVNPDDYRLLGMEWRGRYFYDKCLPMGCASACAIFQRFSDAINQVARDLCVGGEICNVLDDFLVVSKSEANCREDLEGFLDLAKHIGIPIAKEKTEGPLRVMVFLGIEIDVVARELRLPMGKVVDCRQLLISFLARQKATLRELQSLIGKLSFACCVLVPGRAFLRRLINLTVGVRSPFYRIRLTAGCKEDIRVWVQFLDNYNGRSMFLEESWSVLSERHVYTDASGSVGFGGLFGGQWFQGTWPRQWSERGITFKEVYPILVAVQVWGPQLANRRLLCHTDNMAVMESLNSMTCRCPWTMEAIRMIVGLCLTHNILLRAAHIPGVQNELADALSRFQGVRFSSLAHEQGLLVDKLPTHIAPLPLL